MNLLIENTFYTVTFIHLYIYIHTYIHTYMQDFLALITDSEDSQRITPQVFYSSCVNEEKTRTAAASAASAGDRGHRGGNRPPAEAGDRGGTSNSKG